MRDFWTPGQHQFIRAVYDRVSSGAGDVVPKVFEAVNLLIETFAVFVMAIFLWGTDKLLEFLLYDLILGWKQ